MAEAERAISAAGHVIVDMADFPAADHPAAQLCAERVRGCDVYVGVLGTRYGSPVRDKPEVSYTELEFDTATAAGLPRLVFLLDTAASAGNAKYLRMAWTSTGSEFMAIAYSRGPDSLMWLGRWPQAVTMTIST